MLASQKGICIIIAQLSSMAEQGEILDIEEYIQEEAIIEKGVIFPVRYPRQSSSYIQSVNSIIAKTIQVLKCPICRQRLFRPYVLPCSHRFCNRCWHNNQKTFKIICPKCKKSTYRNQAMIDKTLPLILKLFHEAIEISDVADPSTVRDMLKRASGGRSSEQMIGKRFKNNELTLLQREEQEERQRQAKRQINIYSTRMKVINFYDNKLTQDEVKIVMDIVQAKPKVQIHQPSSQTNPQKKSSSKKRSSKSSKGKLSQGTKKSSVSGDKQRTFDKSPKNVRKYSSDISEMKGQINEIETRSVEISEYAFPPKLSRRHKRKRQTEFKRQGLECNNPQQGNSSKLVITHPIQMQTDRHAQKKLAQSLKADNSSQKGYFKIRVEKFPDNILTPTLAFSSILCPRNKRGSFIKLFISDEFCCSPEDICLFRNHKGVMKPFDGREELKKLFSKPEEFSWVMEAKFNDFLSIFGKQSPERRRNRQTLYCQPDHVTIYYKMAASIHRNRDFSHF